MNEPVVDAEVERAPSEALVKAAETRLARTLDQPATITDQRIVAVGAMLKEVYANASDLQLTPDEQARLAEPFADDEIEILPTGELYVPHILIRERLGKVLGTGQWSIVGLEHNMDGKTVHIHFILTCRKYYVGETWVSKEFISSNPRANWSDTIEGAEGEAVRRIAAKRLNCGNQVWKPAYGRAWIPKFAVQVWRTSGTKGPQWRRKDCPKFYDETGFVTDAPKPTPTAQKPVKTFAQSDKASAPAVRQLKSDFLANAEEVGRVGVWAHLVQTKVLLKSQPLEHINETRIPKWETIVEGVRDLEITPEMKADYDAAHTDGLPGLDEPTKPTGNWNPPWKLETVPFGKDKDKKFSQLDAKALWYWFMKWASEPLQGWTSPKGQHYPPKEHEIALHALLNEHLEAAKQHYKWE